MQRQGTDPTRQHKSEEVNEEAARGYERVETFWNVEVLQRFQQIFKATYCLLQLSYRQKSIRKRTIENIKETTKEAAEEEKMNRLGL